MKQEFFNLQVNTNGQKLYEFTNETINWINQNNFKNGMLNLSIQHTSASLVIQENADPDVLEDLLKFYSKLVPINKSYKHQRLQKEQRQQMIEIWQLKRYYISRKILRFPLLYIYK